MKHDHEEESRKLLARMEWAILEDTFRTFCAEVKDEAKEQVTSLLDSFKKTRGPDER